MTNPIPSTQSSASATAPAANTSALGKRNQVDQQSFLNLLVEQLKNQDPLNPMDSANFTAQLATFSSLEQLTQIKQGIDKLGSKDATGMDSAFGYLGREVVAASDQFVVKDQKATGLQVTTPTAGHGEMRIFDETGRAVANVDLGDLKSGTTALEATKVLDGLHLPDGTYRVEVGVKPTTGETVKAETSILGRVTGVELGADGPKLMLGDRAVAIADVREVRWTESAGA